MESGGDLEIAFRWRRHGRRGRHSKRPSGPEDAGDAHRGCGVSCLPTRRRRGHRRRRLVSSRQEQPYAPSNAHRFHMRRRWVAIAIANASEETVLRSVENGWVYAGGQCGIVRHRGSRCQHTQDLPDRWSVGYVSAGRYPTSVDKTRVVQGQSIKMLSSMS